MDRLKIDKLIKNYKVSKDYLKANEDLEKIIITEYAAKLNEKTKFIFHGKKLMLEEIERTLDIKDAVNFRTFFEVSNDINLSAEALFNELETIYYNI